MFKKIMLVVASMAVIAIAYVIYQWQGEVIPVVAPREVVQLPRPVSRTATLPEGAGEPAIPIGPNWITAGDAPQLRIYDKQGKARIVFRAMHWSPISDSEFDLLEATVRLALPGGQLAYIWADDGRITVLQGRDNNPVAKRGRLQGNVRLFIDLTDEAWREQHPDRADLDQHAESVVKLWLDHVQFDLDLSLLESDGPIVLQSALGDIEGKGLRISWNERERRIQRLTIAEGRRAVLRSSDIAGMSSRRLKEPQPQTASAARDADLEKRTEPATGAASAPAIARIMPPARPGGLPYIELGDRRERAAGSRIETYRLVFRDHVAAVQKENGRRIGDLTNADSLQILFDFNQSQRGGMVGQAGQSGGKTSATAPASAPVLAQAGEAIELTWTGPLEVIPVMGDVEASPAVNRMQLVIRGPAVQFHSRDGGSGEFPELEYHDETQKVWLRGTKGKPVSLEPSEGRQLVAHGTVSADLRQRTAHVDGPGRFTDRGEAGSRPVAVVGGRVETSDFRNVEIAWEGSVDLEFAMDEQAAASAPATVNVSPIPRGAYLKHAVLSGQAVFSDDRGSIRADKIDVVCGAPRKTEASSDPTSSMLVERMNAIGHVVMTVVNQDETVDTVECEQLEVEFGMAETGKSFPRQARAVGSVVARRMGRAARWGPGSVRDVVLREISAQDGLVLDMEAVTFSLSPDEIVRKEADARARAREQGIIEGSEEWKKHEQRLRNSLGVRSKTIAHRLQAGGGVTVLDLKQELDLAAYSIDCELGRGREEIRKALITGSADRPARVVLGDFFIRGPRIDVDAETQSAEVPGAGTLRFMTRQDLDGRAVDKPIPVVLSWDKHMSLAGDRNTGRIVGRVRAVSETVILDCDDEMRLEFEDVVRPAASQTARTSGRWIFGMLANAVSPPARQPSEARAGRQLRKRLKLLDAVGNAAIEGKVRQEGTGRETVIEQWLIAWNELLEQILSADVFKPATRPADKPTRLASRVLVKGPRVIIRLDEKEMRVEGSGHLLVEDYRLRKGRPAGRRPEVGGSLIDGASVASLEGLGPSQTLFTWVNSMSFLNNRNTAIFDSGVEMRHLSGSKLIELDRVAAAIAVAPARLKEYPGREASLSCDRFTVEFERDAKATAGEPAPLSRATRLKGFWAVGRQVRLEESGRFVEGVEVSFDSASQIGRVIGSSEFPARMRYLDERTGRPIFSQVEQFQWDQRTGIIKVREPQVLSTGR
ncbi:MAG: hypothetical protein ACUVXJ_03445 [Phycisphaerae bacterium]